MTLSGGEMLLHPEFCEEIIDLAAEEGIGVCLDTSGFGDGDALLRLAFKENVTDILYDMKAIDDGVHKVYVGQSNALILENLKHLAADSAVRSKIRMRMPLVSGVNDTPAILEETAALYKELGLKKLTLLPYHDLGNAKMRNIGGTPEEFKAPSDERMEKIRAFFRDEAGMDVEILGKV